MLLKPYLRLVSNPMSPKIKKHFQKVDPVLYKILTKIPPEDSTFSLPQKRKPNEYFSALCAEIIGQQLSGKVVDVIHQRFLHLFPKKVATPREVLKLKDQDLRNVGMSWGKVSFIKDLAQRFVDNSLHVQQFAYMTDEEVTAELTKVKGIGRWTAEMFLMFTLAREDVFSHGDLGLRNAIRKLYKLESPTKDQIEMICQRWSPFKTYACKILWRSLKLQ